MVFGNGNAPGIVPGSTILLSGSPGSGKSTLLLQILDGSPVEALYNTAEEARGQLKLAVERLKLKSNFYVSTLRNVEELFAEVKRTKVKLVVVDSIQCMHTDTDENGRDITDAGSKLQLVAVASKLYQYAQQNLVTFILVCHQVKSGDFNGPQTLAHVVDTNLKLRIPKAKEGLDSSARLLFCEKNRFGSSMVQYLTRMTESGFAGCDVYDGDEGSSEAAPTGIKAQAVNILAALGEEATRQAFIKQMKEAGFKEGTASFYWNSLK